MWSDLPVVIVEGRELGCAGQGPYALPDLIEHVEFRRCTVRMCQHRPAVTPETRPILRDVVFRRCQVVASEAVPIVAEDCTVDTITFRRGIWGPQLLPGWSLKHVVVRGRISGSVSLVPGLGWRIGPHGPALDDPFVVANARDYETLDWALDISEAAFTNVVLQSGIPARLIRRDPSTQVVVRRAALAVPGWRELIRPIRRNGGLEFGLERFLVTGFEDAVLVAATRGADFAGQLEAFARLRDGGYLEA